MSILKPINLRDRPELRQIAKVLIERKTGGLLWSEDLNLDIKRNGDDTLTIEIRSGTIEAVLKGLPDPDFIKAVVHEDHAIVSFSITDVRVDY
jgi:hypothetical protein